MDRKSYEEELIKRMELLQRRLPGRERGERGRERGYGRLPELHHLALNLNVSESLDDSLRLSVEAVGEFFASDGCCIALWNETEDALLVRAQSGLEPERLERMGFALDDCLRRWAREIMEDFVFVPGCGGEAHDSGSGENRKGLHASWGIAVPLKMGAVHLGALCVYGSGDRIFSDDEMLLLLMAGDLAASEIARRKREEHLRQSEARFRFMVETSGDVLYRLEYESMTYDYLSPGIRNLTGYSRDEIEDLGFSKIVMRIDMLGKENVSPELIVEDRRAGRTGEYRADYLIRTKNGGEKWLRDHSFPWLGESNRLLGSVGVLSDVTEYKRAEIRVQQCARELVESEEKYRTLVENVPLVVYRIKPSGEITFVNHFVEEVFGFSPMEVLLDPTLWRDRIHDEDRRRVEEAREESCRQGKESMTEYRFLHKDGHLVHVVDHVIPFETTGGNIGSFDGVIVDITSRVRLQKELLQTEGLRTVSEISARLAHEIRNPLVSLGGFARLLLSSLGVGDPNRAKVEIIISEVRRLESILRMVLYTLQPIQFQMTSVDPHELIESVLYFLEPEIKTRQIQISLNLAQEVPSLSLDRVQMERALEAVIRNALHQMQCGTVLSMSTCMDFQERVFMLILRYPAAQLSDDDIEHFFYPFTTFHDCPNVAELPLSKIIVSNHGGHCDVRLDEQGNLLLRIMLPL